MTACALAPGDWIENRYRILAHLGSGGMGEVYRVSDEARGGLVLALKTMVGQGMALAQASSFRREFRLLTQLRHPNLVAVHNYGVTRAGNLYFTMDYLEGEPLPVAARRLGVVPLLVQVCRALAYIHARRVLHRDLKPANILVVAQDQVKLVDFGIASDLRAAMGQAAAGTLGYVAPEVLEGAPADARSDLYSLGAVGYELLVGALPLFDVGHDRMVCAHLWEAVAQAGLPEALVDVMGRLLAQDPAERYGSANAVIAAFNGALGRRYALETRETASSYALQAPFVGREDEMAALRSAWSLAQSGAGGVMLVGGAGGVGKSRLLEEFGIEAEFEGAWVVWGRCGAEGGGAYQPWREVLRVLVRYVELADLTVMQEVGLVLLPLLPALATRAYLASCAPPEPLEPPAAQLRLNRAIARVVQVAAAARPTLIVLEDAHRAEDATLALVAFLARAAQGRWLLCITYREDELPPDHALLRLEGANVRRLTVGSFAPERTAALAQAMLGLPALPPALAQRLQATTAGNAFFVQELMRSLAEEGAVLQRTAAGWRVDAGALTALTLPESLQQVLMRRIERLPPGERALLRRASVLGGICWGGAVAQLRERVPVAGCDPADVPAGLDSLVDRGFLFVEEATAFPRERAYSFLHSTLRELVYAGIPPAQRQIYHDQAATWLMAQVGAPAGAWGSEGHEVAPMGVADAKQASLAVHAGAIAVHLERAGRSAAALPYLRVAAAHAAARFANTEALAYLERALAISPLDEAGAAPRYALLAIRERVYDVQGAREAQAGDIAALARLAERLGDERRRAEVALRRARYAEATGDYPDAIAGAREAVALARRTGEGAQEAAGLLAWALARMRQGDLDKARARFLEALALAQEARAARIEARCLCELGEVLVQQGHVDQARTYLERALPIVRRIGDRRGEGAVLNSLGSVHWYGGDLDAAERSMTQALDIRREIGDRRGEAATLMNLSGVFYVRGDYTRASQSLETILSVHREVGNRRGEGAAVLILGEVAGGYGDYARARRHCEQALAIYREIGERPREALALVNLGVALNGLGDASSAQACHRQALEMAREIGNRHLEAAALTSLGDSLGAQDAWDEAADAYRAALDIRLAMAQAALATEPRAGLARVAQAQGRADQALAQVREILAHLASGTLDGTNEPFKVYLTCYRVLRAAHVPRAREILADAHRRLQARAARITDPVMRRSFLEHVAAHREIERAFAGLECP